MIDVGIKLIVILINEEEIISREDRIMVWDKDNKHIRNKLRFDKKIEEIIEEDKDKFNIEWIVQNNINKFTECGIRQTL
jgi:hypothetical protein